MPTAMAATAGRVDSKVAMAGCFSPVFWCSRALASLASSFSLPPRRQAPGTRTSSSTTSAVCEARMPCFLYFWPCDRPLRARRDDEAGLAPALELGVDRGDDHVDVGDAAVGDPRLGAVEHPLVLGLVVDGPGAQRAHVGAGVGLGHAEGAELHVVGVAVALRHPLEDLLGGAGAGDARRGEAGAEDRQRDAGVAPEELLHRHREGEAGGVGHQRVGHEVHPVEADLGGLLDDRPRGLLPLVPLLAGGAQDGVGELVDPALELELVVVELEGELGHRRNLVGWRAPSYRSVTTGPRYPPGPRPAQLSEAAARCRRRSAAGAPSAGRSRNGRGR